MKAVAAATGITTISENVAAASEDMISTFIQTPRVRMITQRKFETLLG